MRQREADFSLTAISGQSKTLAKIQTQKRLIESNYPSDIGVLAMVLVRTVLSLLCCLLLWSCERLPKFQDDAQKARYGQYRVEVRAAEAKYHAVLAQQPVPIIQALQQFELFQEQWENLGDAPISTPMRKQFTDFVDASARSSDELTQLLGLIGVKACGFVGEHKAQIQDNEKFMAFSSLCSQLTNHSYPFKKVPEFAELSELLLSSGVLNDEFDDHPPVTDTQKLRRASALTPLLLRRSWQDSSAWIADLQLRAWPATSAAQTIAAPEEFKSYQVDQVEIVFDSLKYIIEIDAYAEMLLEMVHVKEFDLSQSQRRQLLLNVLGHSNNLAALQSAQDKWNEQKFAATDLPAELIRARTELAGLKGTAPFQDLADLNDLKRRLEIVKRFGTLDLARRVKQGAL